MAALSPPALKPTPAPGRGKTASARIPPICQPFVGDKAKKQLDIIEKWVDEE